MTDETPKSPEQEDYEIKMAALRYHPRCYLCKKDIEGGIVEVMEVDDLIGNDPRFLHVKELLEGVVATVPEERFDQGEDIHQSQSRGGDPILCAPCMMEIARRNPT